MWWNDIFHFSAFPPDPHTLCLPAATDTWQAGRPLGRVGRSLGQHCPCVGLVGSGSCVTDIQWRQWKGEAFSDSGAVVVVMEWRRDNDPSTSHTHTPPPPYHCLPLPPTYLPATTPPPPAMLPPPPPPHTPYLKNLSYLILSNATMPGSMLLAHAHSCSPSPDLSPLTISHCSLYSSTLYMLWR